jgi:hypothetical protein
MVVATLLVLVVTAVVTILVFPSSNKANAGKGSPTPAPLSTTPISITLRATPLETHFSIDNGPPLENPYIGSFPRDSQPHVIRAIAPGYPPKQETVLFKEDVSMRFTLSMVSHQP